jgi:segregation and condensation protein B
MKLDEMEAAIEAILFTMGGSVEVERIAAAIEQDKETTIKIVHNLMDKYASNLRGIKIIELDGAFQMCTKPEYYEQLIKVVTVQRRQVLTDALLETLSIIAYKQPCTRLEIEKIRGVSSDKAVSKLVEYGLVGEIGRLDAPGRPILFGTTEAFLRTFGVTSLDELPVISEDLMEEFKTQAEMEIEQEASEAEAANSSDESDSDDSMDEESIFHIDL